MSRNDVLSKDADGVVHACEGMTLEDGKPIAWTQCGADAASTVLGGEDCVTCRRCRAVQIAAQIIQSGVLAWGPPELVSSSLPRSLQ